MRSNPSTEAGRVTTGYCMERPAREESISPRDRSPAGLGDGLNGGHAPAGIALMAGEVRWGCLMARSCDVASLQGFDVIRDLS